MKQGSGYPYSGAIRQQVEEGDVNYERVLDFMCTYICATRKECAEALGLTETTVGRHVNRIRSGWRPAMRESLRSHQNQKTSKDPLVNTHK
jgi:hypothetical protein